MKKSEFELSTFSDIRVLPPDNQVDEDTDADPQVIHVELTDPPTPLPDPPKKDPGENPEKVCTPGLKWAVLCATGMTVLSVLWLVTGVVLLTKEHEFGKDVPTVDEPPVLGQ